MPNRFCAICGKSITQNAPHIGMCMECYLKENPLFKLPEKFSFKICYECYSIAKKEDWILLDDLEFLEIIEYGIFNFLLNQIDKKNLMGFSVDFLKDSFEYSSKNYLKTLKVRIMGKLIEDPRICHEEELKVILHQELCKNCSNLLSGMHYLSIIQLRVKEEEQLDLVEKVLRDLDHYVLSSFEKDPRQYISKILEQKYGVDLYLSTNELMNHIISYLRGKYKFLVKRSKKLVGRDIQRGKNIYRLKTLIKFLPIKKGDVLIIKSSKYRVEAISNKRVVLRAEDGSKLIKNYSYFLDDKFKITQPRSE